MMPSIWLFGFGQGAVVRFTRHQKMRHPPDKLDYANLTHPSERSHRFAVHRNFDGTRVSHTHDRALYEINVA